MAIYTTNNKIWKLDNKWVNKPEVVPPGPVIDEVTIGTQSWMAKNLAIDDGGEGITIVNNVTANNVNFGKQYYYTWDAAVRVAASVEGWHLPTAHEWYTLANAVGGSSDAGTKLKSTTGWNNNGNGTDDYGFTSIPVGWCIESSIFDRGNCSIYWTSTTYSDSRVECRGFNYDTASIYNAIYDKIDNYSVRLIKDS